MLMLPNNDRFVRPNICQREKSSLNTSLVSVAVTDHVLPLNLTLRLTFTPAPTLTLILTLTR